MKKLIISIEKRKDLKETMFYEFNRKRYVLFLEEILKMKYWTGPKKQLILSALKRGEFRDGIIGLIRKHGFASIYPFVLC